MATNESTSRGGIGATINTFLSIILILITIGAVALIAFPYLSAMPLPSLPTLPTADVWKPSGGGVVVPRAQPANVQQDIDRYNAEQEATAQAVSPAPVPNTNNTGDASPSLRVSKPDDRPAPPPPGEGSTNDASPSFGSKPVGGPVDIQGTHTCLHGQIWTDMGCHRPTPTK